MKKIISFALILFVLLAVEFTVLSSSAKAATFASINSQLDFGQSGQNVRNLQTFLASNSYIYPAGLVTGYFGPLTRSAVVQFQLHYGIATVGRVGPQTLAKINSLIASGNGLDVSGPVISSPVVIRTTTTADISWHNNEFVRGKVYYSPSPFGIAEATGYFSEPVITGGTFAMSNNLQTNHTVNLQGLSSNTTYYYIVQSTDASGNVSVTWPSTFKTN